MVYLGSKQINLNIGEKPIEINKGIVYCGGENHESMGAARALTLLRYLGFCRYLAMGVQGLWKLIEPCGRMVPLETMNHKVLAVDVSIWLHQAMKGMHDAQGAPVAIAHLLVLFHRLCKLLFYKIRPVFVFDGGVPTLKRNTMALRRTQKTTAKSEASRVRGRLLKNLLKHEALRHVLSDEAASAVLGLSSLTLPGPSEEEDLYKLPPVATQASDSNSSGSEEASTDDDSDTPHIDIHSLDLDSNSFKTLPAEVRHDILSELQDTRKQSSWRHLDEMPSISQDFSDFQMNRLLKRRAVQVSLEAAGKEMGARDVSLQELQGLLGEGFIGGSVQSGRIAQDDVARFMLIQKPKTVPPEQVKKKSLIDNSKGFDILEHIEDVQWSDTSDTDSELRDLSDSRSKKLSASEAEFLKIQSVLEEGLAAKKELDDCKMTLDSGSHVGATAKCELAPQKIPNSAEEVHGGDINISECRGELEEVQTSAAAIEMDCKSNELKPVSISNVLAPKKTIIDDILCILEDDDNKSVSNAADSANLIYPISVKEEDSMQRDIVSDEQSPPTNEHIVLNKGNIGGTEVLAKVKVLPKVEETAADLEDTSPENLVKKIAEKTINENETEALAVKIVGEVAKQKSSQSPTSDVVPTAPVNTVSTVGAVVGKMATAAVLEKQLGTTVLHETSKGVMNLTDTTEKTVTSNLEVIETLGHLQQQKIDCSHTEETKDDLLLQQEMAVSSSPAEDTNGKMVPQKQLVAESSPTKEDSLMAQLQVAAEKSIVADEQKDSDSDEDLIPVTDTPPRYPSPPLRPSIDDTTQGVVREDPPEAGFSGTMPQSEEDLREYQKSLEKERDELISERGRQERMAQSMTDQMYADAQELLRLFGVPYIIAPMEAEAQCATLDLLGLTEGTITDDSDIWLFGGRTVYKNFFNQKQRVLEFRCEDIREYFKLSREDMVKLALLVGSDYTSGLPGIGPVTALEVLASFPSSAQADQVLSGLRKFRDWVESGFVVGPTRATLRNKVKNASLIPGFPSQAVVEAYLHPEVDHSKEPFSWAKPNVPLLQKYTKQKFGWTIERCNELIMPIMKKLMESTDQTTIDKFFRVAPKPSPLEGRVSKRVEGAVKRLGSGNAELDEGVEKPTASRAKRPKQSEESKVVKPKVDALTLRLHQDVKIPQRELDKLKREEKKRMAAELLKSGRGRGRGRSKGGTTIPSSSLKEVKLSESSSDDD